ncbi:GNAT family N-acetyltransferase [Microcoleus sp. FACHB-1515]|uniref:GNAT family N-acetyltransferase n=1 Tax=Cyanophyceae TaxID=3028117 RepID=UPI0018EFB0F0|nr:GNAT family N-acetyltransferase [Microcoleus sp. FACHB-1515]
MAPALEQSNLTIRASQYRDLEAIARLFAQEQADQPHPAQNLQRWYGLLKSLSWFPNPLQNLFRTYVAENDAICGAIHVSPFNSTHSTWRVDRVAVAEDQSPAEVGTQLLRHCLQTIWQARTWLTEVNVNDASALALYRQNGFQPLAHMTYWTIAPELLQTLAEREPDLPNLMPVSNADACLLHQLDTVSMPPLVRQVFDRQIADFKTNLFQATTGSVNRWANRREVVCRYVFEPQRKAAIGYFKLHLNRKGDRPHTADLTVHPAYTWLYPELLTQMGRMVQGFPTQAIQLASSDYQPEREEYLEQFGATRTEHTLMMSRSVWHKLRESKPVSLEGLQLAEMLQGLQPARKPIPSRFTLLDSMQPPKPEAPKSDEQPPAS